MINIRQRGIFLAAVMSVKATDSSYQLNDAMEIDKNEKSEEKKVNYVMVR